MSAFDDVCKIIKSCFTGEHEGFLGEAKPDYDMPPGTISVVVFAPSFEGAAALTTIVLARLEGAGYVIRHVDLDFVPRSWHDGAPLDEMERVEITFRLIATKGPTNAW